MESKVTGTLLAAGIALAIPATTAASASASARTSGSETVKGIIVTSWVVRADRLTPEDVVAAAVDPGNTGTGTAAFMLLLDITVVSVALPSIQRDLRASLPDLQWVSAAYALVLAVLLLPVVTLGDRLGRRLPSLVGLATIFTAW